MHTIADALGEVRDRITAATRRSGREPGDVLLVGAVKGVDVATIEHAVAAGLTDAGENTAQQLRDKAAALGRAGSKLRWHYLGAIQTNKIRLLDDAQLLHGLDRVEEARALQARAERTGRTWDVLVEVNVAGEQSKQGIEPSDVDALLDGIQAYPAVRAKGFMLMAPQAQNPEDVRWTFAAGRRLRDRYPGTGLDELSMGMTDDFEVAIEEGATIVRIGRAIFAPHRFDATSTPRGN